MSMVAQLAAWSIPAFIVLLFIVQSIMREVGFGIGRRYANRGDGMPDGIGIVVGSMLGLLAFVLALTLSFANTRFSERRAGTLAEANAIGTAWLRAEAIGHPRGLEVAHLLEEYTRVRAAFVAAPPGREALDALNQRTQALQNEIWGHVAAVVREKPDTISSAFMASLNDTFDMTTAERFAFDYNLPAPLFWLMIGMMMIGMLALGIQLGMKGSPIRILASLLTLIWTLIIVDILDLSAARIGEFRTTTSAYDWTLQGMGKDITIPPLPPPR